MHMSLTLPVTTLYRWIANTHRSKLQGCVGVVQERHKRSIRARPLFGAKLGHPLPQQQRHAPPQRPRLARCVVQLLHVNQDSHISLVP